MRTRTWLAVGAAAVAVAAAVVVGLSQAPESDAPPALTTSPLDPAEVREKLAGAPGPLAGLHRQANEVLPGGDRALRARLRELRGHPVVVNLWAAWCGPCREELPILQRASLDWGTRVAFLGVDLRDDRDAAIELLRRIPLTYPSYEDPDGAVYNRLQVLGVPTTVFYDATGRQVALHTGPYVDQADLDDDIRRYAVAGGA